MRILTEADFRGTYAFLDPASGKKDQTVRKVRARSAIIVGSIDCENHVLVRKAWAERCSTARLYEEIYKTNEEFNLNAFGVESNAQQSLFVDMLAMDATKRRVRLPVFGVCQPTSITKEFRIRTRLNPRLADGRIIIQEGMEELVEELLAFPMGDTVDLVDALASLVHIVPEVITTQPEQEENEALLEYLRNSGAPAHYIEQVSAQAQMTGGLGLEAWAQSKGLEKIY